VYVADAFELGAAEDPDPRFAAEAIEALTAIARYFAADCGVTGPIALRIGDRMVQL
jgi:hypothetical protein